MGADLSIKNDLGDMAKDLAERFAHLSCVKLLTSACLGENIFDIRTLQFNYITAVTFFFLLLLFDLPCTSKR